MPGLYAPYIDWMTGNIITEAQLDGLMQYLIDKHEPQFIDDESVDVTAHNAMAADLTTLPTSLRGEIHQLRKAISLLAGTANWASIFGPVPQVGTVIGRPLRLRSSHFSSGASVVALSADMVLFSNGTRRDSVSATLDIALSGPAANGRDWSGNFTNTQVHVYWIWNPTTVTVATIGSGTFLPSGPVMPAGYTEWAYATTIMVGGTNNRWLRGGYTYGSMVFIEGATTAFGGLTTAGSEQLVPVTPDVPGVAIAFDFYGRPIANTDGAGDVNFDFFLRLTTGIDFARIGVALFGLTPSTAHTPTAPVIVRIPNIGNFRYQITNSIGVGGMASAGVASYYVPNGDS